MKLWLKLLIICITGAVVWGLAFLCGIYPTYAVPLSLFSAGIASLSSIITGFTGPKA